MIRTFAIGALTLMAEIANAETIVVKSGEHADFSRIVLQFSTLESWDFGRVEGGYELRSAIENVEFDLSEVYDFIPKNRISNLSSPGSGRLFLLVSCDCTGDIFEIRDGRIVIDIKDGSPDADSQFETPLADIEPVSIAETSPPILQDGPTVSTLEFPIAEGWPGFGSLFETDRLTKTDHSDPNLSMARPGDQPEPPVRTGLIASTRMPTTSPDLTAPSQTISSEGPAGARFQTDQATLLREHSNPPDHPQLDATNSGNVIDPPFLPIWPTPLDQQVGMAAHSSSDGPESVLETALLNQLSRAAAQGLINIAPLDISDAQPVDPTDPHDNANPALPTPIQPPTNLRMETAADRSQPSPDSRLILTSQGTVCVDEVILDVAIWGDPKPALAPMSQLRTGIVGEFDRPNIDAILNLARRYIYLGFGAEAKILLRSFPVKVPNSDILIQLAEIMDDGFAHSDGRLFNQLSCETTAAMWAILASEGIPVGAHIDEKNVLLTFSGLPAHLRRHLGPPLTKRFLDHGDIQTATSIRDLMDRVPGLRQSGYQLTHAQLASTNGNVSEQLSRLETAVAANGSHSAVALADLIETKLELGQVVSERYALLASALAVENRDSEIGRRLTRAAIRAFAVSGQIEPTFTRIFDAKANGYISEPEAQDLLVETHLRNTQISSDASFLSIVYRHGDQLTGESNNAKMARLLTATRLVSLGFARHALDLYSNHEPDLSDAGRMLLARANLGLNELDTALSWLVGLTGQESQQLRAQILTSMGDYAGAAAIYQTLEMGPEFESTAWLAGDWTAILSGGESARVSAAQMFSGSPRAEIASSEPIDRREMSADTRPGPIAEGNLLVAQSSKTREILKSLLSSE